MLFTSAVFAAFLAVVLPTYYLLQREQQNKMLLVASYVFYGWWDWRFLILLAVATTFDFFIAKRISGSTNATFRKRLVAVSVSLNLGYLGFFKYFNFLADNVRGALDRLGWHPDFFTLRVLLPIGISFYTFQSISYVVDVYRNRREHTDDFVAFALYLAYFPHLVAGPIQRSTQLLPQLLTSRTVTPQKLLSGVQLMLIGYFKKVAIADAVAPAVSALFDTPGHRSALTLMAGIYLFAIQIYCDFSGYTDIARGVSRLMGIELRINFLQPYLSANIAEFWRRWHISLSEWLRDYLYISLGGSRRGRLRTYVNLMITMVLGGLWHGASWTFVCWGALHGLYLAAHRMLRGSSARPALGAHPTSVRGWIRYGASVLLTFNLVCFAWIFFRAPDLESVARILGAFRSGWGSISSKYAIPLAFYGALVLLLDVPAWWRRDEQPFSPNSPVWLRGLSYGIMLIFCFWLGSPSGQPFIYFQF